jgi:hypothetical protein
MEPVDRTPALLPPMPEPPEVANWWLVTPSPMEFENIGFSKPINSGVSFSLVHCWRDRSDNSIQTLALR